MRATTLIRPRSGSHAVMPLAGTGTLVFSFSPAGVVFRQRDTSLLLSFPDGASLELAGFFPDGAIPALAIILADGTRMDAAEMLTLFAPHLALPPAFGLAAHGGGRGTAPIAPPADLSALAAEEELLLSPENARADDSARNNLLPVYQEVIFRDGEITIGPSVYGNLLPIGEETVLHVHLDNNEAETLDMDDLIPRLPGLFPENQPIRAVAVTGGADNRVILTGKNLSPIRETIPLRGLGTTQFDRYEYRPRTGGLMALYIQTILPVSR